tara:strand:- start:102 stop:659 length:558 start_codon:yes stop_codon:yes gene_type:complete
MSIKGQQSKPLTGKMMGLVFAASTVGACTTIQPEIPTMNCGGITYEYNAFNSDSCNRVRQIDAMFTSFNERGYHIGGNSFNLVLLAEQALPDVENEQMRQSFRVNMANKIEPDGMQKFELARRMLDARQNNETIILNRNEMRLMGLEGSFLEVSPQDTSRMLDEAESGEGAPQISSLLLQGNAPA